MGRFIIHPVMAHPASLPKKFWSNRSFPVCATYYATLADNRAQSKVNSAAMAIRIAHVNVGRGYRGGQRQTEILIRGLASADVQQVLVARRGDPLAQRLKDVDLEVKEVSSNPLSVAMATRGADVVHAHDGRSVYGAYLRSLISQTPYIVTRRVSNPLDNHWFTHKAYRRAAFVAAISPHIADIMGRYDSLIRLQVIHSSSSGLPVDAAESASIRNAFPGKLLIGHVAALDNRQKGQEFIIQVAMELQESDPDIQFMLVGGGDDEMMLRKAAEGLNNLAFAGFVDNVGDYLAACDVFILPSNKEGLGSILLDAMEQRLPVIASRVGGVPDIVHDDENGILIDPGQPQQLKAGILRLRDAPELRRKFGERGHQVAKNFSATVMTQKYLRLYQTTVNALVSAATIRALCIIEDADRPTIAMFIGMRRAGIELTFICPHPSNSRADLSEAGFRVLDIQIRSHIDFAGIRQLRNEIRQGDYNIMHVFSNKALQNGLLATLGIPIRIIAYRGIVGNVSFLDPISWTRFLNPRIDRIVCVADAVRDYFLQMRPAFLRMPVERPVTIYKGHSLDWYTASPADLQEFGIPPDAFVVGCVANFRPRKGIELLVDAMTDLPENWQVHLLLVGHMDAPSLTKRIAASPVANQIHRVGHHRDAPSLAAACDVFVLPSIKREGLARSLIEAMAYGTPPIVTDCGGSPEVVVDGVSGLVVPVRDVGAISLAIRQMHEDSEMRQRMGQAARERIGNNFRIEDTIAKTIDLYRSLVAE